MAQPPQEGGEEEGGALADAAAAVARALPRAYDAGAQEQFLYLLQACGGTSQAVENLRGALRHDDVAFRLPRAAVRANLRPKLAPLQPARFHVTAHVLPALATLAHEWATVSRELHVALQHGGCYAAAVRGLAECLRKSQEALLNLRRGRLPLLRDAPRAVVETAPHLAPHLHDVVLAVATTLTLVVPTLAWCVAVPRERRRARRHLRTVIRKQPLLGRLVLALTSSGATIPLAASSSSRFHPSDRSGARVEKWMRETVTASEEHLDGGFVMAVTAASAALTALGITGFAASREGGWSRVAAFSRDVSGHVRELATKLREAAAAATTNVTLPAAAAVTNATAVDDLPIATLHSTAVAAAAANETRAAAWNFPIAQLHTQAAANGTNATLPAATAVGANATLPAATAVAANATLPAATTAVAANATLPAATAVAANATLPAATTAVAANATLPAATTAVAANATFFPAATTAVAANATFPAAATAVAATNATAADASTTTRLVATWWDSMPSIARSTVTQGVVWMGIVAVMHYWMGKLRQRVASTVSAPVARAMHVIQHVVSALLLASPIMAQGFLSATAAVAGSQGNVATPTSIVMALLRTSSRAVLALLKAATHGADAAVAAAALASSSVMEVLRAQPVFLAASTVGLGVVGLVLVMRRLLQPPPVPPRSSSRRGSPRRRKRK